MTKEEFIRLLFKDCLSDEEKRAMKAYLSQNDEAASLLEKIYRDDIEKGASINAVVSERMKSNVLLHIEEHTSVGRMASFRSFRRWGQIAAIFAVVVSIAGGFFMYSRLEKKKLENTAVTRKKSPVDIHPGTIGATLTMADGTVVVLDTTGNGVIANTDGSLIRKTSDGALVYDSRSDNVGKASVNKLSTPIGRTFKVVLPDGSLAYLNAGSSLSYPTAFTGKERNVEMNGEVYFEVEHDATKPFKVHVMSGGREESVVRVLGTHFNIKSYDGETNSQTTLCQGSIQWSSANIERILTPGEQLEKNRQTSGIKKHIVDTDEVTAWVNGDFNFHNASVEDIMQQIARWYGVVVMVEGDHSDMHFNGVISRNSSLQKVMKILELGGVKYQLDGNKITIQ
ncbi:MULTISPECIES: FecR domain-containing protein [Chitinophagaceae]